jgi:predicted acylesterase/phospholipase RssA
MYEGLCISSGGFKGLGVLGALTSFHSFGYLKNCKNFAGCSVGSIIVYLYAIGWDPTELYLRVNDVKLFESIAEFNINNLQNAKGLMDNERIRNILETLVVEKRIQHKIKMPTLLDLHNEGIYIAFSVTDRVTDENVKIDWRSDPHLKSVEAALMSANIPLLYEPMKYKNMLCSDGAMTNPFPIDYLDNGSRKILGISVFGDKNKSSESIVDHATRTLMIPIEKLQKLSTKGASSSVDIMEMVVKDISYFKQSGSDVEIAKTKMFKQGLKDGKLMHKILERRNKTSSDNKSENPPTIEKKDQNIKGVGSVRRSGNYPLTESIVIEALMHPVMELVCQASISNTVNFDALMKRLPREKKIKFHRLSKHLQAYTETPRPNIIPKNESPPEKEKPVREELILPAKPVVIAPRIRNSNGRKREHRDRHKGSRNRPTRVEEPDDSYVESEQPTLKESELPYQSPLTQFFNDLPQKHQTTIRIVSSMFSQNDQYRIRAGLDNLISGFTMITGGVGLSGIAPITSQTDRFSSTSQPKIEIMDDDE